MNAVLRSRTLIALSVLGATTAGCTRADPDSPRVSQQTDAYSAGRVERVLDTTIVETIDAAGTAEAWQQAELSTKLLGTVTAVLVREGDAVQSGQALLRIDSRDLEAKAIQAAASLASAEAVQQEATVHAARFRALFADSAATRAQLDAALTGLARADAGVRAARAAATEVDAVTSYATVRAPFRGTVVTRHADPGAFASPGAPLIRIQDASRLRIAAAASGDVIRELARGQSIDATIDDVVATARVEGIVPSASVGMFTINAVVENAAGRYRAGSVATLHLPLRSRRALLVPIDAIAYEGDLTGVMVRRGAINERRWVRLGIVSKRHAEIVSGVLVGDSIVVPTPSTRGR